MRRLLPYGLIVLGVLIMLSPSLMRWLNDYKQNELMLKAEQWEAGQHKLKPSLVNEFANVSAMLEGDAVAEAPLVDSDAFNAVNGDIPVAVLEIPVIELKLPVLEGATQSNMRYAAAHMSETAPVGTGGNAAIAAHRARAEGRLFNRLDEVRVGDSILASTATEKFEYIVDRVMIVEPSDLSVLADRENEAMLTLITCTPNGKQRVIVQASIHNT
ncbi:class D sortase [Paenibacillus massiliensis]|uniref:class D sortase n=1 Tax=Paenibacillus massiliensis TaxID=225917 RepID=UPI0003F97271|nr:class D sortase [Paenibacillus massiliensis]